MKLREEPGADALDRVDGLGSFIEFEGLASADADPALIERLLTDLRQSFEIKEGDLLSASYSDLLETEVRAGEMI